MTHKHKIEKEKQSYTLIAYRGTIYVKTKKIMQTHMLHGEWESCVGVMSPGFRMVVPTWGERGA